MSNPCGTAEVRRHGHQCRNKLSAQISLTGAQAPDWQELERALPMGLLGVLGGAQAVQGAWFAVGGALADYGSMIYP